MLGRDSAFPLPKGSENVLTSVTGLSKREYFAGLAMQGLSTTSNKKEARWDETVAKAAVALADALLTELEKK